MFLCVIFISCLVTFSTTIPPSQIPSGWGYNGGCVKTLTQPFFMRKAQTFSSPGFVITQSFRIFRHKVFRYGKVTFSSLHSQPNRSFSTKN